VIAADVARALPRAFEKRQNSDYEDFAEITGEDASRVAADVAAFVETCARALERAPFGDGPPGTDAPQKPPRSS
jgi:hypothetical protein